MEEAETVTQLAIREPDPGRSPLEAEAKMKQRERKHLRERVPVLRNADRGDAYSAGGKTTVWWWSRSLKKKQKKKHLGF